MPKPSWHQGLNQTEIEILDNLTVEDLVQASARVYHHDFIKYTWMRPDPFIESVENGFQQAICEEIDNAIRRYREGLSSYLCVLVPSGHGKSDITSRYLPVHFLGEFPDAETMVVTHNDDKVSEFGDFGRKLIQTERFRELYPTVQISSRNAGVMEWGINGRLGKAQYTSLGSGSAGKRCNLLVVDDFFGKREHAESPDLRVKAWTRITQDYISRRAPVTIVIWVVTPWHVDDPIGRLKKLMDADPDFPQFKFKKFAAESKIYPSGWLFPERYTESWYKDQKKILGNYGWSSTMQCEPYSEEGVRFRIDKINYYDSLEEVPYTKLRFNRAWDVASSVKQTKKDDPDFTAGAKIAVHQLPSAIKGETIKCLIIDDLVHGRWEATRRQEILRDVAISDGHIRTGVEAFGGYKDAYTQLVEILKGVRQVEKLQLPGDKLIKSDPLVPIFEAGNVWVRRAPWNAVMIQELTGGTGHDDIVDAIACGYHMGLTGSLPGMFAIG